MPSSPRYEVIKTNGCSIAIRRADGPLAREIFARCLPEAETEPGSSQAEAVYRAISDLLTAEGGSWGSVAAETCFYSDIHNDLGPVRKVRAAALADRSARSEPVHALTEIEQAPLAHQGVKFASLIHAVFPAQGPAEAKRVSAEGACRCVECERAGGLRLDVGDDVQLFAGNLYGAGADAYEQTHAMFLAAERLLENAGLSFSDVMRTWIYLPFMERDYDGFNRARRQFFQSRNVDPIPASTGIGAGLAPSEHMVSLGLYATRGPAISRRVMSTPTLNEAPEYGSDFSRGMRVEESNRRSLFVSGTASLDETGATVHPQNLEAQIDRMLLNVANLLEQHNASFADIVAAITYVKRPEDAPVLQAKLTAAGYEGFPNLVVHAPVCRPELLCETEALAVMRSGEPDAQDR